MWNLPVDGFGPSHDDLLCTRNLEKAYGQVQALRGVTVTVRSGEALFVAGPGGSGKTTLLNCLAGVTVPEAGEVWFDGIPVHSLSELARAKLRRDRFGLILQQDLLLPELSAEENVALPLRFTGHDPDEATAIARAWLDRVALADCAQLRPGELAAGKAARLRLARALVFNPQILLADEPTAGLSRSEAVMMMRLLIDTSRARGSTLIVATADARLCAYADRQVSLRDGQVSRTEVLV